LIFSDPANGVTGDGIAAWQEDRIDGVKDPFF
jgi:hypothetical protein